MYVFLKSIVDGIALTIDSWRQAQQVRATRSLLASLDAATLRDLGLHDSVDELRYRAREHANRYI